MDHFPLLVRMHCLSPRATVLTGYSCSGANCRVVPKDVQQLCCVLVQVPVPDRQQVHTHGVRHRCEQRHVCVAQISGSCALVVLHILCHFLNSSSSSSSSDSGVAVAGPVWRSAAGLRALSRYPQHATSKFKLLAESSCSQSHACRHMTGLLFSFVAGHAGMAAAIATCRMGTK
jgi:hypothetical protein